MRKVIKKSLGTTAIMIAGTMLLAACSATGGGATSPDGETGTGSTGTAASEWTPGPLDEFQSRIFGWNMDPNQQETQAEAQARIDREGREQEEMIAACMSEQGFTYIVRDSNFGTIWIADPNDGPQWGTREFAEQFGFGMANSPWSQPMDVEPAEPEVWVDPNQDILDAMSEAEREAWNEALWGAPQEGEWDPMLAGCAGQAQAARWPETQVDDQFVSLQAEMDMVWQQIQSDPRILNLNNSWASCMANAGYPGFTDENAMFNSLNDEFGVVQGWEINNEIWGNWDWDAYPDGPDASQIFTPDPADLAAFGEREIAIAVANHDCREQVSWDSVQLEVNHDLQQRFVDQHRAELEAWAQHEEASRAG